MTLPEIRHSRAHAQQALITGQVLDSLTQQAPEAFVVQLSDRVTGARVDLSSRTTMEGRFVFYSRPVDSPLIAGRTYQLQLTVSAPNYAELVSDLDVTIPDGQPAESTIAIGAPVIHQTRVRLFSAGLPSPVLALQLLRNPIGLQGTVYRIPNVDNPVAGATVMIVDHGMQVVTDDQGFFEFAALPLERQLEISVDSTGFETVMVDFEPDYRESINRLSIGLTASG